MKKSVGKNNLSLILINKSGYVTLFLMVGLISSNLVISLIPVQLTAQYKEHQYQTDINISKQYDLEKEYVALVNDLLLTNEDISIESNIFVRRNSNAPLSASLNQ